MYNDLLDHGRERVSQKEKNPGLSGTYVHGVHVMLHNCLNRAVKERLLVRNPADDVIVPKIDKKEMKILPPEQVKAYLNAASVRGVLPLFYLELTSGLRKGEIAALLWSDLDVENCTLSVTKQLVSSRDGELKITQPKTATSVRLISLPQETVELLKEEHAKHPLNIYMFPSPRTGGMYHPASIVKLHEKILNDAGIEHLRFHDLRHSFATYALQRWIRTTEGIASRFTVCPIWPLWNSPIFNCVGAGGRIRTPDLLITNVGRSINELISGAFCSFRVGDSTVYKPATSIQYIRSCSRLGHGLGQTLLLHS